MLKKDFKYSETIDEKLEVIITNVLLATSSLCILLGIICTYYDIKSVNNPKPTQNRANIPNN